MNTEFIYEYWNRTELGRAMIASNNVSESDLLFLIPNNIKKMHGLPMTRVSKKDKSKLKRSRRRHILSYKLFDLIEEMIADLLPHKLNNEFFDKFVDVKNVEVGN